MVIGDLNKKFGWVWLLIGPLMGLYIGSQFNSLGAVYASVMKELTIAGQNLTLYMGEGPLRAPNRLLHVHSALLAFMNIVYGMNIDNIAMSDKTKKLGSILAIVGTVLVTLGFYFLQVADLRDLGFSFRVLGGISVVAALIIMVVGELKK